MRIMYLIFAIKLCHCEYVSNLFDSEAHETYSTVQCMNSIMKQSFPCGMLTAFVNPNEDMNQLIKLTNEESTCHSVIVRSFYDRKWFIWTNTYVITAQDYKDLKDGMEDIATDVFWNPRASFIIQINKIIDDTELRNIFEMILKYKIYHIVVLKILQNDALILTYNPFDNHNCGKGFDNVITLGTCESAGNKTRFSVRTIPKTVRNCSLRIVATEDVPNFIPESSNYTVYGKYVPGLEQFVLDTIAARLGYTVEYEVVDSHIPYGVVLPNRSTTGLLNYIERGEAEGVAGGFVLMQNKVELFEYLWGFNYAAYNVYTPTVGSYAWKRVYKEFGTLTWLLIIATLCFVMFLCIILKTFLRDKSLSILNLWGYFFGNANKGLSSHKKFRMVILSWAWFAFFINSFYNTALVSLVSVHVHETAHTIRADNLKTLPYKPCISEETRSFFEFAYNQSFPQGECIYNCTFADGSLEYAATTKKFYAIEMEYTYKMKEYLYINPDGHHLLESWTFSSINVIVMYLVRGFPHLEEFQRYASRMYEGGLVMNHLKTIQLRSYSVIQRHPKEFVKTNTADLSLHFCALFVGYAFSCVCFMFEFWYNDIKLQAASKRK